MSASGGSFWRGLAAFVILCVVFVLTGIAVEFLFSLANDISKGWPSQWGRIVGAGLGGFIGVGVGKIAANAIVKRYPARVVAGIFIGLNGVVIVGDLIALGTADGSLVAVQVVRGCSAIAAAVFMIWLGKGPGGAAGSREMPPVR